ncbi:VIT1/CCC1 family protein [Deltaproteobacteria bacterium OttesenSCG-928-K17]|nr:VIT1/CCC1 family protein [Deltaproteobacteria bacterium OttesenSCG-928-K17]
MPKPDKISPGTLELILKYQKTEETDHLIYSRMAAREKNADNRAILARIAAEEKEHAAIWARYTGRKIGPNRARAFCLSILSLIFGYTFIIKLMEKGEYAADQAYRELVGEIPEAAKIIAEEQAHEIRLAGMLDEERLKYVGSMVLGLNDALVELSGTLAGLTLALANTRLVALAGIITGISATLSMAASNYLAERADGRDDALKSSLYTGAAYLVTVVCLVAPYLLLPPGMYLAALGLMLAVVVLIIMVFNYYLAVAKNLPFGKRFREMAAISLGVALISFGIGLAAKKILGVDL